MRNGSRSLFKYRCCPGPGDSIMPNSNLWAPNDQPLVLMESPGPGQPLYLNKDLDPGVVRDLVGILMFLRLDPAVA